MPFIAPYPRCGFVRNIILVGASYGGFMIRAYASKYPDNILGTVYVDSNSVYFFDRHPAVIRETEEARASLLMSAMPRWLIRRLAKSRFESRLEQLDESDVDEIIEMSITRKHMAASAKYARAFGSSVEHMRRVQYPSEIPAVVITRGLRDTHEPWTTSEREEDWRVGQKMLFAGVLQGSHIVATESQHEIPLDQPELVIQAVSALIARALP